MFFYAGVPAIVGALVLMGVFALLGLTGLETLMLIGGYGVVLKFFSLNNGFVYFARIIAGNR